MTKRKLVVVGNGMAGVHAVEELIAMGGSRQFEITIFGDEPYGNYNRILLPHLLSGTQGEGGIYLNSISWYADHGIGLHLGSPVTEVDRASKVVFASNGINVSYDLLLLATGSRPYVPPVAGMRGVDGKLKPGIFSFRTLDDCRGIIRCAQGRPTACVIGDGIHTLEVAQGLRSRGCVVRVLPQMSCPMTPRFYGAENEMLYASLTAIGASVCLREAVSEVLGARTVSGVEFEDGSRLECDMLVVTAGAQPNAEIGVRAGLTVERGIVVDDYMRSIDDYSIYAVGECAQHRGVIYGLIGPLWEQADVFAKHVTGWNRSIAYRGLRPAPWVRLADGERVSVRHIV